MFKSWKQPLAKICKERLCTETPSGSNPSPDPAQRGSFMHRAALFYYCVGNHPWLIIGISSTPSIPKYKKVWQFNLNCQNVQGTKVVLDKALQPGLILLFGKIYA
jgi:hypothetical protein